MGEGGSAVAKLHITDDFAAETDEVVSLIHTTTLLIDSPNRLTAKKRMTIARYFVLQEKSPRALGLFLLKLFRTVYGRGIELVSRKGHFCKCLTRIVGLGHNTFFVGNAEFRCRNDILSGAFNSYDREKAERNVEISSVIVRFKIAAEKLA